MNKIYKVVWSKVRNAYVVVSELAKRNSKTKSQHTARVSHSLLSLAVVTSLAVGSTLLHPMVVDASNTWGTATGTNVAAGSGSTATGTNSVAVGTGSTASGTNAAAIAGGTASDDYTLAFGLGAQALYDYNIAMGYGAVAGGQSTIGGVSQIGTSAIAIGRAALAYGLNDVVIGANQTAIAPTTTASEDTPDGTGLSSALGGRVMIGHDNIAYGRSGNSVIIGSNNRSNAIHGIAIGQNAVSGQPDGSSLAYENTMSIGTNTRSYSTDTIAIGNNAIAGNTDTSLTSYDGNGESAVAIGSAATSTSGYTVAIGGNSSATDLEAIAIGKGATASSVDTIAVGYTAKATNTESIAIGIGTAGSGVRSLAIGRAAQATGENSVAIGRTAAASGTSSIAQGYGATAGSGQSIAIGRDSNTSATYAIAFGVEATASGGTSIAQGYMAKTYGSRSIAIGRAAVAGTASTDPDAIAIGSAATTQAESGIAIGTGANTNAFATGSIAVGKSAAANVSDSVALGSSSSTTRTTDSSSSGWNAQNSTWSSYLSTKGNAGTTSGGVWNSSSGVVSIGTDGASGTTVTRKLTGLAAGVYDTDAVNMAQWTNTMLATTGDVQDSSYTTTYGSDGTPRTATKLLNESLLITGGGSSMTSDDLTTDANIGTVISDNTVTLRLAKALTGLESISLTNSTTGNSTVVTGDGITITPSSGDTVSLTNGGLDNGNNTITNVAAGVNDTDAVNVKQLEDRIGGITGGSGTATNITVEGGTAAGTNGNYAGENLQVTTTTATDGSKTYDMKLADNLTLGSSGTTGTDGSVTVNGKDGSSVAINGADGSITAKGADGSAVAINGADGSIGLTGSNGTTTTIKGGTSANDVNGNAVDRITVGDQTVATLNDGMVYTGDTGSAAVKLNKTVNIVGGETDASKLSTDNNIGIVAAQDGDNGKLTVRLAKDITGLNTVTAGDATIGTQTETTASGIAETGSYVTGLDNTTWNVTNPDIVTGRAATEDQLKTVSDAVVAVADGTSENATGGFGLADGSGTTVKQDLGKTITVKGGVTDGTATTENPDGVSNITTAVKDGALEVSLNKDLDLGSTGSVTTGNTVINNDGVKVGDTALTTGGLTITNGPSVTTTGIDAGSKQITNVASGSDGTDADGNPTYNNLTNGANIGDVKNITNTTVNDAKTELTNKGLDFTADSGDAVHRDLGETLNIAGDGNITTTSDAANGKITVGLSDTIALGEKASEDGTTEGVDSSITVNGKDGSAVTINGTDGSIALNTGSGSPVNIAAGTQVNNLAGTPIDRITVGGATVATLDDGMKYGGDFGTVSNVKLNNQVDVKGEATTEANLTTGNIGVVSSQDGDNGLLVVKLNKDLNLGENGSVTTGNTVINNSGLTITNGPSVTSGGINAGGSRITNVATGTDGTDAVNVAQLEDRLSQITIGESKTTEVTVEGGTAAPTDGSYAGDNLQVKAGTTANGSPTYDVKLADNITLGSAADSAAGTTGTDGSITLNGANGSSVAVNGADGSVTAKGTDGSAVAINGSNGSIVLNTGSGSPVTIQAGTSANNLAGTSVDRISVGGQTVATMSDGLKYAGDDGQTDTTKVIAKTLNEQLDIVGGAEGELTDKNIGVNNVNGQLKVQLVKDINLGTTGSVTVGTAVLGNQTVTTAGGVSQTGTYLTGLGNTAWDTSNPDAVTGRAATEDQLKAVNDKVNAISTGTGAFGLTDDDGNKVTQSLGETIQVAGDGQNITTTADAENGKITVALSNDISIGAKDGDDGTDGVDGKIGVNGKDGSSVVINGADGSIGLTGPAGEDGAAAPTATIAAGTQVNNLAGTPIDRITVGGATVATLDDGMKYGGDFGTASSVKLNNQVNVKGNATTEANLTDGNIGVVSSQDKENGLLTVKLNKDINLGSTGSLTFGSGDNTVSISNSGLNNGGNQITKVGSGSDGEDADGNPTYNTDTNGANIGDVKNITETAKSDLTNKGMDFTADSGETVHRDLGEALGIVGDGQNITTTADAENGKITVGLSNDLSIGTKGADGKDGVDGTIGVNGKDGSSVVINGTDGISVKGADGKDGVTISGKDGVDGVDGAEGHIGLNGKDGMTDIYTTPGQPGVNGKDGETMTRIIYTDPNGANHEVATLDDGMKYTGDTGSAAVALNKTVNIVGGETDSSKLSTDNNIGIVAEQADDNAKLTVRLAKDITGLNTVTAGDATIGTQTETTAGGVAQTGSYVTGLDNTTWNVSNPDIVTGRAATEDQLKTVSDAVKAASDGTSENATGGFGLTDDNGNAVKQDLGQTIQIAGDGQNITTTADAENGKITVGLSNDLSIGAKDGADGTDGVDGKIGVNGKDGSAVVINGADGSIGLTGPAGADGTPGTTVTIKVADPVNNVSDTPVDRITVGDQTVATLSDGMKYGGDFGDTSKVKLNNQVNVKDNAKNEADLTDGNIGVVSSQDGENGQLLIKLNKDLNLGDTGSVTMGNTVINNSGVTIGSGTSSVTLTDKGLNNGGNQITNVASGTTGKTYDTSVAGQENYNNAANIGDLNNAVNNAVDDIKDATKGGGFALSADDNNSVKQNLGDTIAIAGDGNTVTSVKDGKLVVGLNKDVDLGTDGSLKAGNTTINNDGVAADKIAINGSDISIDKDGINAGNTQIKNVASGADGIDADGNPTYNTDTNGANIGDVKNIANAAADAAKAQSGKNITVGADNKVNLNDNITLGSDTDASKQVTIDGNGATVTAGSGDNQVKLDGSKGQISAGGAVLGNQANTANDGNPATGNYLTGLDNTTWDGTNIQSGRAATEDQLKVVDDKVSKGRVFQGDDGADNSVTVGLGDTLKLNGGADTSKLSSGNIGVVRNSSGDGLDIKLSKDLKDLDSVTTGNTTINNSGVTIKTVDSDRTITIQDSNVNMGNNVVSGVADGTVAPGSTEAINGGQLALRDQAINNLGGEVNKLDNRINRVGAGAAALAALHPQDFDPDDKWDFAFGYGHYRGANAGAFGAFYKPNEDTTFSVGGTIGGGENMINAGVSFKLGQGNNVSNSRVGMAKEIKHLRDDVAKLEDIVNRQSQMINQLTSQNPGTIESKGSELFPDVPANHWAYEYVTKLHQLGIIEGYPDGNFDGNRMMTRYEFAAVVYRAIMAGAASNAALQGDDTLDRLANEFSAELKYIRIDTIAKDKDGKPTIQRVRIVPENKQN